MHKSRFTFVDMFSGIGGFHVALSNLDGTCLLASDIDPQANQTYELNFGLKPVGDISKITSKDIPEFDVLCGGFPCQSFSNVGQKGGLEDPRGALIFEVARILGEKQPKAFILENVRGLLSHDQGKTFKTIENLLEAAGYSVKWQVLVAKDYGLPQIRKRLFIVGVRADIKADFEFPIKQDKLRYSLEEVMGGTVERDYAFTIRIGGRRSGINNRYNWDAYKVNGKVRYITPEECKLLQGFPKNFKLTGTESLQYKQVGNSVPVSVVQAIGQELIDRKIIG
jgi:DNA (cytosine-5)-methyltransferase 1